MNKPRLTKLTIRIIGLFSLVLSGALFSGCAGPMGHTSKYMAVMSAGPSAPPPGMAMVCIHRPRAGIGAKLYTAVWDDAKFVADLGNGHSSAYVCTPGLHHFLNLSVEETGCIEAQLLPDQIYDLRIDGGYGVWIASFKIVPVHQDAEGKKLVAEWTRKNRWVERPSSSAAYEQARQADISRVIEEFTTGRRHDKLQHLAPDDHR